MENFKVEIVSPEKLIYSDNSEMVTIPSYEGEMGILKDHTSIITFLRPGIIKIKKGENELENFFVEDGIVEFLNNILIILSTSALRVKELSKKYIDQLSNLTLERLNSKEISDEEKYLLNHKIDLLKNININ